MSELREAVARAIYEARYADDGVDKIWPTPVDYSLADAAIAAMQDAEPTEAEVEAAVQAYHRRWQETVETGGVIRPTDLMRAALIAARKVQP